MPLPRPASPRALLGDLRGLFAAGGRHRLVFAAVAIGMTSLMVTAFVLESRSGILPGAQLVMVSDWHADRSDAAIVAQQKIDQRKADAARAEKRRAFERADKALTRLGI